MRTAIYARVSTRDKQDSANQTSQLREFAVRQNWQLVLEFIDTETGSTADRPQFQAMFRAASQRKFDVLLFWSLDRLTREGVLETLQHLNRLTSYGVNYRSYTEQYIDSCGIFREAVIGILAAVAKQERIRISERTRAGIERARREGKTLGRPRQSPAVDVAAVKALRASGLSWEKISVATGIARSTLQRAAVGV